MEGKSLLFKLDGHEVVRTANLQEWIEWMDWGNLTVEATTAGGVHVSTVFLGLAAPRALDGPPLLFETALLRGSEPAQCVERYATWDEAEKGHAKWVKAAAERRIGAPQSRAAS